MNSPKERPLSPVWPESLERHRMDDSLAADAYAAHGNDQRACLKTAIAFQFHYWREAPHVEAYSASDAATGFCHGTTHTPLDWTGVLLSAGYCSPARLLAALLPAVLAGVERIAVLCPEGIPDARNLLALELAGVQDIFILPGQMSPESLLDTNVFSRPGNLLAFPGGNLSRFHGDWEKAATVRRVPMWTDSPAPELGCMFSRSDPSSGQRADLVAWCHADARIRENVSGKELAGCRAAYTPERETGYPPDSPDDILFFGPGLEGCWLHSSLSPSCFRTLKFRAGLYQSEEPSR